MSDRMPGATWMPLPEADQQGRYTKSQLVFHSTGTTAGARANQRYFSRPEVAVESTFIVDYDGEILQILPAGAKADANGSANKRAISVEVIGTADQPFTASQLASCIRIAQWACDEHPIARCRIPSEAASGIGWHVMFGAPGPWTSVRGKECPGPARIAQVRDVVIPAAQASVAAVTPPTPPKGAQMFITNAKGDSKQYLIQNGGGSHITEQKTAESLRASGVPWVRDADPAWVASVINGGSK